MEASGSAEQLLREQSRSRELEARLGKVNKEVTEANQRENDLRAGVAKKDKEVALIKHELKEAQRKAEQDLEARKKAECEKADVKKMLDEERNRLTQLQNNHHQVKKKSILIANSYIWQREG